MKNVFISYQRTDRDIAEKLWTRLQVSNYNPWMDIHNISKGAYWPEEIDKGLDESDLVIGLMSPEALGSRSVKNEWYWALDNNKPLIPLLLRPCEKIPHRFTAINYIDFSDEKKGFSDLEDVLKAPQTHYRDEDLQPYHLKPHPLVKTHKSNRLVMLEKVRKFWIEGVLYRSLGSGDMNIGISAKPDAVLRHTDYGDYTLPHNAKIADVFADLHRELLILGIPGVGKTTLMLKLTQDLITEAVQDEDKPIPVVFNLFQWAVKREPLDKWLIERMQQQYQVPKKAAKKWLENGAILPLLDGLDEVAGQHRDACAKAINLFRCEYPFIDTVVCSRTEEYNHLTVQLNLHGAIILEPLSQDQIDAYVQDEDLAALRQLIKKDKTIREMAQTPFLLNALSFTYRGMKERELLGFSTFKERRDHLFKGYIQKRFKQDKGYTLKQTRHYLVWLGRLLLERNRTVFYIEDLQPTELKTGWRRFQYLMGRLLAVAILGMMLVVLSNTALNVLNIITMEAKSRTDEAIQKAEHAELSELAAFAAARAAKFATTYEDEVAAALWDFKKLLDADPESIKKSVEEAKMMAKKAAEKSAVSMVQAIREQFQDYLDNKTFKNKDELIYYFQDGEAAQQLVGPFIDDALLPVKIDRSSIGIDDEVSEKTQQGLDIIEDALAKEVLSEAADRLVTKKKQEFEDARREMEKAKSAEKKANDLVDFSQVLILVLSVILLPFFVISFIRQRIKTVETVKLSWGGALVGFCLSIPIVGFVLGKGAVLGWVAAVIITLSFTLGSILFGALLKGLFSTKTAIEKRVTSNQGIRQSARNALLLGMLFGAMSIALNAAFFSVLSASFDLRGVIITVLGWSLVFVLNSALIFGGTDVIKHLLLRFILFSNYNIPWNCAKFLDFCAEIDIMRKVGGGYIFVHRYLMEYFAGLE
ncbi:MAG: TIR domain-containing protein [Candidatus Aminicenantes bacterium]|nr:TIR domain-containing protein [Candidatus Aminicenantes bacterium]NIM83347.1 TIR domain-containing protein [Candidatus Aminicenantes bacterium]NIN22711.1 TIR domain-containing protein [Candidatus Aminicenantes bacterium]NIN46471.1 TIR domain-containing protein [Candidatus Aminicenantes bacterium]NIN89353.1 TIR domain-containing protein [Candidatus Aminicenantes bacterium]